MFNTIGSLVISTTQKITHILRETTILFYSLQKNYLKTPYFLNICYHLASQDPILSSATVAPISEVRTTTRGSFLIGFRTNIYGIELIKLVGLYT
jgi:hypothetical protein